MPGRVSSPLTLRALCGRAILVFPLRVTAGVVRWTHRIARSIPVRWRCRAHG